MQTGWENLANRIILQAVKDYRRARIILGGKPGKSGKPKKSGEPAKKYARSTVLGVERFFQSRWFAQLTDVDGEMLLETLRKEKTAG